MIKEESIMVDFAKSLAICLMVVGHSGINEMFRSFIYVFHMPLFYIISGFCFKDDYYKTPLAYLRKRIKSLYLPFVVGGVIFVLLHNFFQELYLLSIIPDSYLWKHYDIYDIVHRLFDTVRFLHIEELIGGFWFLPSLFWSSFIFYFSFILFKAICDRTSIQIIILLLLSCLASYYQFDFPVLHFKTREILGASFIATGYMIKNNIQKITKDLFIVSFSTILIGSFINREMSQLNYIEIIPYFLCAVFTTLGIIQLGLTIEKNSLPPLLKSVIHYIGHSTKDILLLHFLSFKLVTFLCICIMGYDLEMLRTFPVIKNYGLWPLYSIFGIVIPLSIKKLFLLCRRIYIG